MTPQELKAAIYERFPSLRQAAPELGVHYAQLCHWVRGTRAITRHRAESLAYRLDQYDRRQRGEV